ncbi:MAG: UDP-N-acetylmuramate--L-alanine ligase [Chitinophagaceae bacterium]|nr:UDP-N-acetylmuramate--L-alanine ligase [Chitinophagaceae bacterium]
MIDLNNIKKIYFIGIGGIGMSAVARYFKFHGKDVSGYDKTETALTKELVKEKIVVHYQDDIALAPKDAELIVYTPAVSKEHSQLGYYQQNDYPVFKRSDVLGMITSSSFNICVAGTHGKTTVSAMVAHTLRHSDFGCNAFLGGIAVNYNTNFWRHKRNVCVVEADEYDRSFLKLNPDIAVITSMDADHLDIYGTEESMQDAFIDFSKKLKNGGLLLTKYGLPKEDRFQAKNHLTYSLDSESADVYASNIRMFQGSYEFDVRKKGWILKDVVLNMGGRHNVENALVAIAVAHHLGIEDEKIKDAIHAFKGVKRRFEYVVKHPSFVFIDDYAHHPEELRALITGTKSLFSGMKCTVVFQPHLFTRTRDFADGFAEVLDMADEVVLLPIYPARELPIEGVTSEMILSKMSNSSKKLLSKAELLKYIKDEYVTNLDLLPGHALVMAGAGDIDAMVQAVRDIIERKIPGL